MFECETHHYLDGFATPTGWWWTKSTRFRLRRPVMVDPIANRVDIEMPAPIKTAAGAAGLSSGGPTGFGQPSW